MRRIALAVLLVPVGACAGQPKILAPRLPPAAFAPPVALPLAPPARDHGRVVIWTTDGPMHVIAQGQQEFQPSAVNGTRTGELCVSPCVVDMPPGKYKLFMTDARQGGNAGDVDDLTVGTDLTYYLRAPGRFEHPTWIPAAPTLVATLGVTLAAVGLFWAVSNAGSESSASSRPGLMLFGVGVAVGIGGSVLIYDAQRGSIQQGATTSWSAPLP